MRAKKDILFHDHLFKDIGITDKISKYSYLLKTWEILYKKDVIYRAREMKANLTVNGTIEHTHVYV